LNRTVGGLPEVLVLGEGTLVISRGLTIKRAAVPSNFANSLKHHDPIKPMSCTMESLEEDEPIFQGFKDREVVLLDNRQHSSMPCVLVLVL
jgi:hypothetical protein